MWICPICKQSKRLDKVCARCGFDMRADFLELRTVTPVRENDRNTLNECINQEAERKLHEALARDLKRYEKEREEWEKKVAEEQARLERERKAKEEQARLEREQKAKEERARLERERKAKEEQARLEREQKAKEERARLEREQKAKEERARLERERKAKEEQARLERERKAKEEQALLEQKRETRINQAYRKQREDLEKKIKSRRKWLLGIFAAVVVCPFIPLSATRYTGIVLACVGMILAALQRVRVDTYKHLTDVKWKEQELRSLIVTQEKKIKSRQTWLFWLVIATVPCFIFTPMIPAGACLIVADIVLAWCCAVPRGIRKCLVAAVNEGENGT